MEAIILKSKSNQSRNIKVWRDVSAGDVTYAFSFSDKSAKRQEGE